MRSKKIPTRGLMSKELTSKEFQRWLDAEREVKEWNREAIRSRGVGIPVVQNSPIDLDLGLDLDGGPQELSL